MASSVENLTALAFPFLRMDRFAIVTPTFSDNSVKLILRFASITSKLITILIFKSLIRWLL